MEKEKIIAVLSRLRAGRISVEDAFQRLRHLPYEDLGFAKIDHHRRMRTGMPEVVFCQGKTVEQVVAIYKALAAKNTGVVLTRADQRIFRRIKRVNRRAVFHPLARFMCVAARPARRTGLVGVVCAGTADIPVAEEAALTAEAFGSRVERVYDVGVAGVHRLLDCFERIAASACIVAVAGMDGALPSVIGGLAACPVIAVPSSVGYGANFNGIAPLLTMLNSCAPNVSVVNVNNGFGAGYIACMINKREG